jgi:CRISPR system Cascade subunit CasB
MSGAESHGASPPPGAEETPEARLIEFLRNLSRKRDRGALAGIRRGLGRDAPGAEALRLLVPRIPASYGEWQRICCFQVAALFALHPEDAGKGNLGDTFRQLGGHESAQKRFARILSAQARDIFPLLRQAVALARSKDVPVNYLQLLKDLFRWDRPSRSVQDQWARSYWSQPEEESDAPNTAAPAASKEV